MIGKVGRQDLSHSVWFRSASQSDTITTFQWQKGLLQLKLPFTIMHKESIWGEKKKLCIIFHIDSRVRSLAWLRLPLLYFPSQPVMQFVLSKILSEKNRKKANSQRRKREREKGGSYSGVGGVWMRSRMYQHELARPRIFHWHASSKVPLSLPLSDTLISSLSPFLWVGQCSWSPSKQEGRVSCCSHRLYLGSEECVFHTRKRDGGKEQKRWGGWNKIKHKMEGSRNSTCLKRAYLQDKNFRFSSM